MAAGNTAAALERAEKLVEQFPRHASVHLVLADAYAAEINHMGRFQQMRTAARIRSALERALDLDPRLVGARESLLMYYLQAPWIAGGSIDAAAEQAEEIRRLDPVRGRAADARVLDAREQPAESLAAWKEACERSGGIGGLCLEYGLVLQKQARWSQAWALFEAWLLKRPDDAAAWYQIGRISALSGGDPARGIEALSRFLALPKRFDTPRAEHAWLRLAEIHQTRGDRSAAVDALQRALAIDPDYQEAREALARLR
nr:tetratricopeptide repeat protein [Lysobacter sp. CAU 1642]